MLHRSRFPFLRSTLLLALASIPLSHTIDCVAQDEVRGMKLVFSDDFERGRDRWETTDDSSWDLTKSSDNQTLSINKRVSNYTPKHRSPHNIAWLKDLELKSFAIKLKVRSTKDTVITATVAFSLRSKIPTSITTFTSAPNLIR